ncbi:MAG TPA: HEAT repeat domain-containing protein, partial [Pirellulaceae bacterium]|nr:HEAT repeat domain-containing protein [Pirellulaceae bacterium]
CATCHARRELLAAGYQPGADYADHYATELLSRLTYHADGQIEDEDFEHGSFLQSKMYHKGIRCTDCHDPHSAKPKHEGNKLCTSCHQHPAGKYDSPLHHHHQEGGQGASCVACHMPTTTYMDVHVRHDHSLRVPRPDLSVALSTPNACTACHLDQKKLKEAVKTADPDAKTDHLKQYLNFLQAARTGNATIKAELSRLDQWSAEATKKWYGEKPEQKQEPRHFAFALSAARNGDVKANELLADVVLNRTWPAIVRATALTEWQQYGSPEMLAASITSLQDPNPLVRAAAAGNLMFAPPEERIAALVPLLKDPDFIVRRVAARTLVDVARAMTPHDRGELNAVLIAWTDGLLANNDRGGVYLAIGSLQQQRNGPTAGEAMYREAIRVEPNLVGARANLAAALEAKLEDPQLPGEQRSRLQQEIAGLRAAEFELIARDARLAPENASVQYRYGLALYLRGEMPAALAAIEKAVTLSPRVTEFRLSYALLLQKDQRVAEAIEQVETILRQTPDDAEVRQLLRELREQ